MTHAEDGCDEECLVADFRKLQGDDESGVRCLYGSSLLRCDSLRLTMIMEKLVQRAFGSALFCATKLAMSGSQSAAAAEERDDEPASTPSAAATAAAFAAMASGEIFARSF